jgi:predicted SnoaL-like aldol condensation-catalyzing enzyme
MKMTSYSRRSLAAGVLGLALAAGYSSTVSAVEYTAQEKANIAIVRGFYDALDTADKGDTKAAIAGIANKYIASGYIQHTNGDVGRDKFISTYAAGSLGNGTPQPQTIKYKGSGDLVLRLATTNGNVAWRMYKVENGMISEHWGPGGGSGGRRGGAQGGAPAGDRAAPAGGSTPPPAQ